MLISEHYPAFTTKTLLVLTNNELAKLYLGEGRDVQELEVIDTTEQTTASLDIRRDGIAMHDIDAAKHQRLVELYGLLSARLLERITQDPADIILCVPEANKNELAAALHPDVHKHVRLIVPKNLASMELTHVVRILFET